jgi:hypothetical protein
VIKYRLSTLLLLIVIAALALGWYVDHRDRSRRDIIGTWHYPTPEQNLLGYVSSLEIRADGTFTKHQMGRFGSDAFEGKYCVDKSGRIAFHILSKTERTDFDDLLKTAPKTKALDVEMWCRCAVDKSGYLILDMHGFSNPIDNGNTGIHWEGTFAPK